jgi:acetyl-CoA C-acetyltransferase
MATRKKASSSTKKTGTTSSPSTWLVSGLRTPFTKVDGELAGRDAIELSVPVVDAMIDVAGDASKLDMFLWGSVAPNLTYSNIAREIWLDAGYDPHIPSFSTTMACSTSMVATFEAASMLRPGVSELALVGGVESMSRVQIGLSQKLSDWLRRLSQARSTEDRLKRVAEISFGDVGLYIPSVKNRVTQKSMGEHCEEMAKTWAISRESQDELALRSHERTVAARDRGFFDDLLITVDGLSQDTFPRANSSMEKMAKLRPAFDRESGQGTLTAANSSPLTDGAAALWVATDAGLERLPKDLPRVKLLDWETAAVDVHEEGLLMAPAYAIPRLLARHGLRYDQVDLWEIHEAFAAQVLCNVAALEDAEFVSKRAGVKLDVVDFPWDRLNPNGGSVALGHPFGATGARILSQTIKELADMPRGSRAIVSICADGGLGTVALLESA